jgi:hypothetical protein
MLGVYKVQVVVALLELTWDLIKIQDESIDLSVAGEIHYSLLFKC